MGKKLYVGNLNYAVNEVQLEELFHEFGDVKNVKIIEGRGFGFVEMSSEEEAQAAQEALNGQDFQGRTLRIDEARAPKRRDHGGGRNDSRGGGYRGDHRGGRGGSRGGGRRGGRDDGRRGGRY